MMGKKFGKGLVTVLLGTVVGCSQSFAQEDKMESLVNENATCIQECHCVNKNYTAEGEEIYDRFSQQYRKKLS